MLIGAWASGPIVDLYACNAPLAGAAGPAAVLHDWRAIWLWPAAMAIGIAVLFALSFRDQAWPEARQGTVEPAGGM